MEIQEQHPESPTGLRSTERKLEELLERQQGILAAILKEIDRFLSHPPLTPTQMRAKHQKVPHDYDLAEARYRWANDVLGPLRDDRDAMDAAILSTQNELARVRERVAAVLSLPGMSPGIGTIPRAPKIEEVAHPRAEETRSWNSADERQWRLKQRHKMLRRHKRDPHPAEAKADEHESDIRFEDYLTPPERIAGVQSLNPHVILVNETDILR